MEEQERIKWEGFDGAIIGTCNDSGRFIYDTDIMIATLMSRDGMSYSDAWEYLEYNVLNNHILDEFGKYITPIHLVKEHNID